MAIKSRRQISREFKVQVIREIEAGKTVAQAAREHQLRPNLIGRWQKHHAEYGQRSFAGAGHAYGACVWGMRIQSLPRLRSCNARLAN